MKPIPAQITLVLDAAGLDGPDVDLACGTWEGNPAGDVDAWEAGTAVPTAEQLAKLADLCRVPVALFFEPMEPLGPVFMCDRTKRTHGLTIAYSSVDERGVLHRRFVQPSRGER